MARDPERRARSREADRIRKRAKRELANMQTRYNETSDFQERRRLRESIKTLQADIAQSYANPRATLKRGSGAARAVGESALISAARRAGRATGNVAAAVGESAAARAALGRLSQRPATSKRTLSQGIDFEGEFREAGRGGVSVLGEHGDLKVSAFYRVTQGLWETRPPAERNQAIIEGLGVSNLRAAYAKVMGMPDVRRALRRLMAEEDNGHVIETTSAMAEAYYAAERGDVGRKSRYPRAIFAELPVIESVKAYGV